MSVDETPRLPEPSKTMRRLPVVVCARCGGSGWDSERGESLCQGCHGYKVVVNLPWSERKPRAAKPKVSPEQIQTLRHLGCVLPEYPAEGTPEWLAFSDAYHTQIRERISKVRADFEAKWGPGVKFLRPRSVSSVSTKKKAPTAPAKSETKPSTAAADPPKAGVASQEKKTFPCGQCDKVYMSSGALYYHLKVAKAHGGK